MKKILFVILIFICISCQSQQKIEHVKIGETSYIKITKELLVDLFNMPTNDWVQFMLQQDYEKFDDMYGGLIYKMGEVDSQIQAISKNDILLSITWSNIIDNTRIGKDLEKTLKRNSLKTIDNISYYQYKKYIIGIQVDQADDYVFEQINIALRDSFEN